MGPRYFLFQAYSPRDEPMGPCIKDCSPDFAAKHQIYLCDKESYVDMAKAAGFQLVSSELVHSLGRFPGKDKVYQREFIFLVLKKPAKSWRFPSWGGLKLPTLGQGFWREKVPNSHMMAPQNATWNDGTFSKYQGNSTNEISIKTGKDWF